MKPYHHPETAVLKQFAAGDVGDQLASIVAAHIEGCNDCREQIKMFESEMTRDLMQENCPLTEFPGMVDQILDLEEKISSPSVVQNRQLQFSGKSFDLPNSLVPLKRFMGSWKKKLNTFHYSKIGLSGVGEMYFLFFEKGVNIPLHTHKGNEYVYVIAGSFEDGVAEYSTGDFVGFTHHHTHAPKTEDPDGCLLLVCIEAPFHFQRGWSRLLNLFGRWLY